MVLMYNGLPWVRGLCCPMVTSLPVRLRNIRPARFFRFPFLKKCHAGEISEILGKSGSNSECCAMGGVFQILALRLFGIQGATLELSIRGWVVKLITSKLENDNISLNSPGYQFWNFERKLQRLKHTDKVSGVGVKLPRPTEPKRSKIT